MDTALEPDVDPSLLQAPWGELGRSLTLGVVSLVSKFILGVMNDFSVEGQDVYLHHILHREPGVGLITVSNHTSTLDDPAVFCAMTPAKFFFTEHLHHNNRWTLCAKEYCYKTVLLGQFFQSGKTLPIERGAGPDQPVMQTVAREVARGRWLHIFPEGRVNYTGQMGALRWGVGKVVCDAVGLHEGRDPIVLPFYHSGMGAVMPKRASLPRPGKRVAVVVGQPVPLADLTCNCHKPGVDQKEWRQITARVGHALKELERRAPPNVDQVPRDHAGEARRGAAVEGALPAGEEVASE